MGLGWLKKKDVGDGRCCNGREKGILRLATSISRQMIPVKQTGEVVEAVVRIERTQAHTGKKTPVQRVSPYPSTTSHQTFSIPRLISGCLNLGRVAIDILLN